MTNTKSTKRALVASVLVLALCFSMLVGTTFAWFTDSVTSGNNVITSGNLDISLEYWDADAKKWEDVAGSSDIFDKDALWEPGYTKVVYLKVENLGSLALKYQLGVNIVSETGSTNVNGKDFKLSDYIYFDVFENVNGQTNAYADRDAAMQNTTENTLISEGYSKAGELKADAAPVYLAMVVYMPESVGNDANAKTGAVVPTIELGVNVIATQLVAEKDSFDNKYDEDSEYPSVSGAYVPAGESTAVKADDVVIDVNGGANGAQYELSVSNKKVDTVSVNGTEQTTISLDISLTKDGAKAEGETYPVSINVGKNLNVIGVTHNSANVADFNYDPATGIVTFTVTSFSPFTVTYKAIDNETVFEPSNPEIDIDKETNYVAYDADGNGYTTFKAAIASGANKIYMVPGADLGSFTHIDVDHSVDIYGNGAKISGGERDLAIDIYKKLTGDITVNVYNLDGIAIWGGRSTDYTVNVNLYACQNLGRVYLTGTTGVNNITVDGCEANKETLVGDTVVYSNANGIINITNSEITGIGCPVNLNHKVAGEQTVNVIDNVFTNCSTVGTAAYYAPIRLYNSVAGANQTFTAEGNTFTYTDGKAPVNKADVLLNAKHNGEDATGTIKANVQINATVDCGANVDFVYVISDAEDLAYFASEVNKGEEYYGNTYENITVVLTDNIDLGGVEWAPIGSFGITSKQFKGIFDGNGYTISNFKITEKAADRADKNRSSQGLFGNVNGTIKNLTVANATVDITNDGRFVGGIVGRLNGGLIENCKLVDSKVAGSAWQIGGVVGQVNAGTILKCTVENTTVAGKAGVAAIAGFQMEAKETTIKNCIVKNCTIAQNGSYGEDYDDMFAAVIGCVNNSAAKVTIDGCIVKHTTIKDVASAVQYGYIEDGATVIVDGYTIIADGLGKNGVNYAVSNANGLATLNAMMKDQTAGYNTVVNLTDNIDFTGKTWTPVDSHADTTFTLKAIYGNGYTISNLTVNGQAMFTRFAGFGDVEITNVTFDNANVNSNGTINTSILTVQTYQNVLLDNVDVKNSTISGGYKVAPLIATVYNEGASTITATLKNCDVENVTVKATSYDFCTTGMVAFVNAGDNDKIVFENCTVTNVTLIAPNDSYKAHAAVYTTGSESLYSEAEGVTVNGVTFEAL